MTNSIFMPKLVFDIETIGEDFNELDKTTQEVLTCWIKKEASNEDEYRKALEDLKDGLGFSPLTGEIVAIGVLDVEKNKGVVYYQSPDAKENIETQNKKIENFQSQQENDIEFKICTEKEMLEKFWEGAKSYDEFIGFNSRSFDVPFMMVRSAIHGVLPSKNLLSNRYLNSQIFNAKHIDLLDQLTFYGAVRKKGGLHLWCRAFGIKSPKDEGVKGEDVAGLFENGEYLKIAEYNVGDLRATRELYLRWEKYFKF